MQLSSISLAITRLTGGLFTPQSMFLDGTTQGGWYDPSDLNTLFQDAAGTTPVTSVEQPVGLMLDKSKGLVLGPELVTNGDFSQGVTGWTLTGGWSISGGSASSSAGNPGAVTQTTGTLTIGKWYVAEFDSGSTNPINAVFGGNYVTITQKIGKNRVYGYCTGGTAFAIQGGGPYTGIDNISVRELPGNHAFNSSGNSANFPVLSAKVNTYLVSELYSDVYWTKERVTLASGVNGPYGRTSTKVVEDSTAGYHDIVRSNPHTVGVSLTYVAIMKAGERNQGHIRNTDLSTGGYDVVFTLEGEGSFVNSAGGKGSWTGGEASIRHLGEGWYLCTLKATPGAGTNSAWAAGPSAGGAASYAGTTGSGIYLAGVDLRVSNDALNQPAYQRVNTATDYDTVGFKPYLKFNGTNQWLQTNSIDFSYGDKMFVCAGVRKLSDAARGMVAELGANPGVSTFQLNAPLTVGDGSYSFGSSGSALCTINRIGFASPISNVVSGIGNISGDLSTIRINGDAGNSNTADQGTGNYGNYPLYIGARGGSSLWFNGRLHQLVVAGKQASASEIGQTEAFANQKTGAY